MTSSLSSSALNKISNLLYEFSIPLGLSYILQQAILTTQDNPNTPTIPTMRAPREWFSQPRPCTDQTVEVLTVNLKQPSTVSSLAFQVLNVPCVVQGWYQDRNQNWIPLTDLASSNPISVNINYSASTSWYAFESDVVSVVAIAVQLRIQRNAKAIGQMGNGSYVVGIKETLICREVYTLADTVMSIESQQDPMGNNITAYVKDWQAANAIDNDPGTYWKSFPCPDPMGVVSYFMDIRDGNGNPQLVDTLFIDPVFTGNSLNVYYSTNSPQSTTFISPVNLVPDIQINSTWAQGVGMSDTSTAGSENSQLLFPLSVGPLIEQPMWVGIEWTPNFSAGSPPPSNPILFRVSPGIDTIQTVTIKGNPTGGTWTLIDWTNTATSALAYNASATAVQNALQALLAIGSNNVSVYASAYGGPYIITFTGSLGMRDIATLGASGVNLTGGTGVDVLVQTTTIGSPVPNPSSTLYWPTISYNTGAGTIVLSLTNGTNTYTYSAALSPALQANMPYQVIVGWAYNPSVVYISVTQQGNTVVASTTINPATNLPKNITIDGETGYDNFCGLMTALVIEQNLWSNGSQAFQSAATIFANPGPVQPGVNGVYPSTSLDNALLAVDWTTMQYPVGGTSESWYENVPWTPIFANYTTRRGNLFFPQKINASWLKLEFYNLTPEPYPVYDQGISITYDTFPVSVLSAGVGSTSSSNQSTAPLTLSSEIISNSIGSVNWFNPSTIQNAINSNWGVTQPPVQVVSGPGTLSQSLPNISQSNVTASYRSEQSSPWIYNRQILNPTYLAGQALTQASTGPTNQTQQSTLSSSALALGAGTSGSGSAPNTVIGSNNNGTPQVLNANFSPVTTSSNSNVLSQMGANWWLFPGANLKMPAQLMQQMTGTQTVVGRGPSAGTSYRFPTTCVHRYAQNTLTLDAPVAYFAGLSEVQAYISSYVASNDPPSFFYSRYDPSTFVYDNINQLPDGPLTTQGSPFQLENPNFLYPLELSPWTATGNWYWDSRNGIGDKNTSGGVPCAAIVANGNPNTLISEPIAVTPGDDLLCTAYVAYYGAISGLPEVFPLTFPLTFQPLQPSDTFPVTFPFTFESATSEFPTTFPFTFESPPTNVGLSISLITYSSGTPTAASLVMPPTTATYTVGSQAAMLALSATEYQSCTITGAEGGYQGTYTLTATPASNFSNWLYTGYGTYVSQPTGNIDGEQFLALNGTYTVPAGVDHVALSLNVNAGVTAGNIYWDNVSINPVSGIEGTVYLNAVTTSTFASLSVEMSDSGLMNSDGMWAQEDPLDTNISNLQLAPYVTTIPGVIPSGTWGDNFATWDDVDIMWGEPISEVAINIEPNLVYNGNRCIHFTRVTGAGEAGITITQRTNLMPQELVQIGAVFYKTTANANQITLSLVRVSDGVVVYTQTFNPVVGYWYTSLTPFFELPDVYDQVYELQFVTTGDAADELYLADLYLNCAGVRYFIQLGDIEDFNFDVTPLVYSGYANVSCTTPVNEFSLTVGIFNPDAWCYGIALTPHYLK